MVSIASDDPESREAESSGEEDVTVALVRQAKKAVLKPTGPDELLNSSPKSESATFRWSPGSQKVPKE